MDIGLGKLGVAGGRRPVWIGLLASALVAAWPLGTVAQPPDSGGGDGWALYIDNDALTPAQRDKDYTGGFALTLGGAQAREAWLSTDGALAWIDARLPLGLPDAPQVLQSLQYGSVAFTPGDAEAGLAPGDRPFASLLYVANGRSYVGSGEGPVYHSSLTIGALGLDLVPKFQRQFHKLIGASEPDGWDHQISDGGEPTFRYTLTRQDRVVRRIDGAGAGFEAKTAMAGSIGYLTEASAALSFRWGWLNTPWWGAPPDRVEYIAEPAPVVGRAGGARRELYLWGGVKAKTRLYNAFLQGQFRDSDLHYRFDDVNVLVGEAWAGVTAELPDEYRVSWVLRYQTSELKDGAGDRSMLWGGLVVSRSL